MKSKTCFVFCMMMTLLAVASAGEQRVAVVSLSHVIRAHPDVAPNEAVLEERRQEFEAERREMLEKLQGMKATFDEVREDVENRALSEAARADSFKAAQEKYVALREYEKDTRDTQLERQKSMSDLRLRMRKRIIDKIQVIVEGYATGKGIEIVLNSDVGQSAQVLYHAKDVDITEDIIKLVTASPKQGKK